MQKYIGENQDFFSRIPRSAVDVIDACTNIKDLRESLRYTLNEESGEEEGDMCKAPYRFLEPVCFINPSTYFRSESIFCRLLSGMARMEIRFAPGGSAPLGH